MDVVLSECGRQQPHWAVCCTRGKQIVYGLPKAWVKPSHLQLLDKLLMQQKKLPRRPMPGRHLRVDTVELVWDYLRQDSEAIVHGYKGISYRYLSQVLKLNRKTVRRAVQYLTQSGLCHVYSTKLGLAVSIIVNQPLRVCLDPLNEEVQKEG